MDRERILNLLDLLKSSSAGELAVQEGDSYVRLRRTPAGAVQVAPAAAPDGAASAQAAATSGGVADTHVVVTARLVGFFHQGQGPDCDPLVRAGDRVRLGQTIGTIESLRQITAVTAPVAGTVLEVLAQEHQPVQFGDALILLRPDGEE